VFLTWAGTRVRVVIFRRRDLSHLSCTPSTSIASEASSRMASEFPPGFEEQADRNTGNTHSYVIGHPTLIEVARRVCSKFPQVRFVLVGDGDCRREFGSTAIGLGFKRTSCSYRLASGCSRVTSLL
jgi:hypothetical protein